MSSFFSRSMLIISLAAAVVVLLVLLVSAWRLLNGGIDNSVTHIVSGPTTIGTEEQRFVPGEPLHFERQSSKVLLRIDGVKDADFAQGEVVLSDGSKRKLAISLEDASGKMYPLVLTSIGSAIGFGFSDADLQTVSPALVFTAVTVHSDAPIQASAIEWYSWTGK